MPPKKAATTKRKVRTRRKPVLQPQMRSTLPWLYWDDSVELPGSASYTSTNTDMGTSYSASSASARLTSLGSAATSLDWTPRGSAARSSTASNKSKTSKRSSPATSDSWNIRTPTGPKTSKRSSNSNLDPGGNLVGPMSKQEARAMRADVNKKWEEWEAAEKNRASFSHRTGVLPSSTQFRFNPLFSKVDKRDNEKVFTDKYKQWSNAQKEVKEEGSPHVLTPLDSHPLGSYSAEPDVAEQRRKVRRRKAVR